MKFRALTLATLLTVCAAGVAPPAVAQVPAAPLSAEQIAEETAYAIGLQAYIWSYPLWEANRSRTGMTSVPAPQGFRAPLNQFMHADRLGDPSATDVVSPNNDTLYSAAWLDLRAEPMVMTLPNYAGRYYTAQLLDAYTNNFGYVSQLRDGFKAQTVVFVPPGWTGRLPPGLRRLDAPTPTVFIAMRSGVDGVADIPNVVRLQKQIRLVPLSKWGTDWTPPASVPVVPAPARSGPLAYWEQIGELVAQNPPPPHDDGLLGLFKEIGLTRNGFDASRLDAAKVRGLQRALPAGRAIVEHAYNAEGYRANGWLMRNAFEGSYFGTSYLLRAAIAYGGLFVNDQIEAFYPLTHIDAEGQPLDGTTGRYAIRFEKGELPPAQAFWSITMLDQKRGLLVANPIQRYSIGDRTAGLKTDADGSVTLYVQADEPGGERNANWLPAPREPFRLVMRVYLPDRRVLNGDWKPPAVRRLP